jgi:hypothetical protein
MSEVVSLKTSQNGSSSSPLQQQQLLENTNKSSMAHYCIHKTSPFNNILSQFNPV